MDRRLPPSLTSDEIMKWHNQIRPRNPTKHGKTKSRSCWALYGRQTDGILRSCLTSAAAAAGGKAKRAKTVENRKMDGANGALARARLILGWLDCRSRPNCTSEAHLPESRRHRPICARGGPVLSSFPCCPEHLSGHFPPAPPAATPQLPSSLPLQDSQPPRTCLPYVLN